MEITTTMVYDFATLICADLDVYGLGEGNNIRIGLRRPLFRSDLERIFERWCPNAEEVQNLHDELKATNDRIEEPENKCDEYAEANNDLGERLADVNENIKSLNAALVAANKKNKRLRDTYENLVEEFKNVIGEKKELEKSNERLAKQNVTLNSTNSMLRSSNKAMSNFSKIFAGGEADCSKCVYKKESEKKDERIEELMNENDLLSKSVIKKDSNNILHKLTQDANTVLMDQNRRYRDTICEQNATINNLKSELEGAIKDRDRVYKELHDKKDNVYEMEIRKLRKERDKYSNDFKSMKETYEKLKAENHIHTLEIIDLKENFVEFGGCDVLHRVYDNVYVVDDGKHVKGFIIVNKDYTKELTNVMTYYTFRNIFQLRLACYGGDRLFTEFCLPKAHYDLAVYSE